MEFKLAVLAVSVLTMIVSAPVQAQTASTVANKSFLITQIDTAGNPFGPICFEFTSNTITAPCGTGVYFQSPLLGSPFLNIWIADLCGSVVVGSSFQTVGPETVVGGTSWLKSDSFNKLGLAGASVACSAANFATSGGPFSSSDPQ